MRSGKEEHLYNPQTIHLLQLATRTGDYKTFKEYTALVNKEEGVKNLRGLMNIKFPKKGISIDEVESVDSIVRRLRLVLCHMVQNQERHMKLWLLP